MSVEKPAGRGRRLAVAAAAILLLVLADLGSKSLAEQRLAGRGVVPIVGELAILVFTRNEGAFLGLGGALPPAARTAILVLVPVAALVALLVAFLRGAPKRLEAAAAVLFLAGGCGNLYDRVVFGSVRDFLNFGLGNLRTGVLNIADLYLTVALVLFVLSAAPRGRTKDAVPEVRSTAPEVRDAAAPEIPSGTSPDAFSVPGIESRPGPDGRGPEPSAAGIEDSVPATRGFEPGASGSGSPPAPSGPAA